MGANFLHGDGVHAINFTNTTGSDIAAGDRVMIGTVLCITPYTILDTESGAINWPNGSVSYRGAKTGTDTFNGGDPVYHNEAVPGEYTSDDNGGANPLAGYAEHDVADSDTTIDFVHDR